MTAVEAYDELIKLCQKTALLGSSARVLHWDRETYLPSGGAHHRAAQLAQLAGLQHEWAVDPRIGELLSIVEEASVEQDANSIRAANIRGIRRRYDRARRLPSDLVAETARTTSLAYGEWKAARSDSDFPRFLPSLERVVGLVKQAAECYGYEDEPYDALLEGFEPGMKTVQVAQVFDALRPELAELNHRIGASPKKPDISILHRTYDVEAQRALGRAVAERMGFDFGAGRLDESAHPFTMPVGPGDTRITTRYRSTRLDEALLGTMHETGHALYEMGLDKDAHFGIPAGEADSASLHESQSRLWENQVGRSRAFWQFLLPQARRHFAKALRGVGLDDVYGAINYSSPSFIRVEADEATYNLHIVLRFELERMLLSGELEVLGLPDAWNSRFYELLGIEVRDDASGCLQDVHWASGLFGYFPTYCLGNLYAAQFFAQAERSIPNLMDEIAAGNLCVLLAWARENIHQHGSRYAATELCERVTGRPLSHRPLVEYLNRKFGDIYGF